MTKSHTADKPTISLERDREQQQLHDTKKIKRKDYISVHVLLNLSNELENSQQVNKFNNKITRKTENKCTNVRLYLSYDIKITFVSFLE